LEEKYPHDNFNTRIRWLILSRVLIVSFILGIAVFAEVNAGGGLSEISGSIFFKIILFIYPLSMGYFLLFNRFRDVVINTYLQSIVDVLAITAIVYSTGGIQSLYSVFYPIVIIYSVIFLGRRGGLLIASAAGIFYGLLAVLEYYRVINPQISTSFNDYQLNAGYVLARIVTHITSFYFTAFLSIFVVDQEKKTRDLLAEKQDAFAKLDILHKSIIESVNLGIITVSNLGRIKSFNRAATEITGLVFKDVENRKFADIFPDFYNFLQDQKKTESSFPGLTRFEGVFHTNEGRELKLGASLSPLRDYYGSIIGEIIIFRDITEILEMRDSLEKSRRLAFIGEVAANLAHEIRNPLASIGGAIQLLKQDFPHGEINDKLFHIILRGKAQLDNFLKDFLLMARPAPGICEEIDLGAIIKEVIDSLRLVPDWPQPLKLNLNLPEHPVLINVNKTEIRQALWNLILNSLQSMPAGGVLTIEVSLCRLKDIDAVEIRIKDNGCGIGKKDLQRVFEPFYTSRDMGTGLGLAVVSRIIENWKGKIEIQSEVGKGTNCLLTIPARVSSYEGSSTIKLVS
jgi:two-component system sensor histidine kinase PilS (NtrC family)